MSKIKPKQFDASSSSPYDLIMANAAGSLFWSSSNVKAIRLPAGTTSQRPNTSLVAGMFRFNTDLSKTEVYDGSSWEVIETGSKISDINSLTAVGVVYLNASGHYQILPIGVSNDTDILDRQSADTRYSRTYKLQFQNSDLVDGVLTVSHNLNDRVPITQVYNSDYQVVIPDNITSIDINTVNMDLFSYGIISGNWIVKVTT